MEVAVEEADGGEEAREEEGVVEAAAGSCQPVGLRGASRGAEGMSTLGVRVS